MHVSRNKCELLAECCINGVEPEFINERPYVKGINITKIYGFYLYIQTRFQMCREMSEILHSNGDLMLNRYYENATQMFYLTLNEEISGSEIVDRTDEEVEQIRKYRELEEDIAYV